MKKGGTLLIKLVKFDCLTQYPLLKLKELKACMVKRVIVGTGPPAGL